MDRATAAIAMTEIARKRFAANVTAAVRNSTKHSSPGCPLEFLEENRGATMARLDQSFIKAYGHGPSAGTQSPPAPAVEPQPSGGGMFSWTVASSTLDIAAPTSPAGPATHYPRPMPAAAPALTPSYAPAPSPAAPSPAPIVIPITAPSRNVGVTHRIDAGRPTQPAMPPAPQPASRAVAPTVTGSVNTSVHVAVKAAPAAYASASPCEPESQGDVMDGFFHRSCTIECSTHDTAAMPALPSAVPAMHNPVTAPQAAPSHAAPPAPPWTQRPWQEPAAPAFSPIASAPEIELIAGFEVDGFRWPEMVRSFAERSTAELAPLVDELVDASRAGRNVVMFAAARRGAGASMLALYAARRAAELGLSVAIVDADFVKPSLARNLGVAPAQGWEDVLARRCELSQCLIASINDRVTLLPLRGSCVELAKEYAVEAAVHLAMLRANFNLVIVDGGPLADGAEPWLQAAGDRAIDFGIVIRDVRHDLRHDSAHGAAGNGCMRPSDHYPAIGVVENFV
jgi:hypothetical protein